jgi:hypothetical protein
MIFNNKVSNTEEEDEDPLEEFLHIQQDDECGKIQTYIYIFLFISVVTTITIFSKK